MRQWFPWAQRPTRRQVLDDAARAREAEQAAARRRVIDLAHDEEPQR
jgi:hypothetical protein